ncbi:MAG: hypothetical protein OEP95_05600 [Myxococcales bacterium]|nr:hypothetical protein [Myxococcales bacterium]
MIGSFLTTLCTRLAAWRRPRPQSFERVLSDALRHPAPTPLPAVAREPNRLARGPENTFLEE